MASRTSQRAHRAFVVFERTVLSAGMAVLAFGVEQILVRAIKKGSVEPAPRTAADPDESPAIVPPAEPREAQLSATTRPR